MKNDFKYIYISSESDDGPCFDIILERENDGLTYIAEAVHESDAKLIVDSLNKFAIK